MTLPTKVVADFPLIGSGLTTASALAGPNLVARPNGRLMLFAEKDFGGGDFDPIMYEISAFGTEFASQDLNSSETQGHNMLSATMRLDGSVIVTFTRYNTVSSAIRNVYFTVYGANGDQVIPETQVFDDVGNMSTPKVAASPDGSFAFAFRDDTSGGILRLRTYSVDGDAGSVVSISTGTINGLDITAVGDNRFLVVWSNASNDVRGQFVALNGVEINAELDIASHGSRTYVAPHIVELADGNFLVTTEDTLGQVIYGRILSSGGTAVTDVLPLNAGGAHDVAALQDGRFVVTWSSGGDIFARIFNGDGTADDVAFPVNTETVGTQGNPTVTVYADGRFMIAWEVPGAGVKAAVFDPREYGVGVSGTTFGDQFVGSAYDDALVGGQGQDTLYGMDGDDVLRGGAHNDTLDGGIDNDLLDGGAGVDSMTGQGGNDTYIVDNVNDATIEGPGGGVDTVQSTVTRTLAADLENLTLLGGGAINGTGNTAANTMIGNSGANTLAALNGNDMLDGAGGNDNLNGGAGADTLIGGAGKDFVTGGGGADVFVLNAAAIANNDDTITDFVIGTDKIQLENSVFAALGAAGPLTAAQFYVGVNAHDADDRIIYNPNNGGVFYDADGQGGALKILIATVQGAPALTNADFQII